MSRRRGGTEINKIPSAKQLAYARDLGISDETLEGMDRDDIVSAISAAKEKPRLGREAQAFVNQQVVKRRGLAVGVLVIINPSGEEIAADDTRDRLRIKEINPDFSVRLERRRSSYDPSCLYPVEQSDCLSET